MANILGGIAVSHTPTIGFAVDHHKQQDPAWAPIFQSFEPLQRWLEEKKPDALVYIFNDHVTAFFFDHYSTFTLGIDSQYDVADEGGGPRCLPPVQGNAALSRHIGASLMADEFDMSFFMDKKLDHGLFSPLSALLPWDEAQGWPTAVIPLQIGVLQFPVPSARRCYKLGQALRRAIESFPEDINVAIVATGALSHQVHGERCGFNNPDWDAQFVDLLVNDPEKLTEMTLGEYAELGGMEGSEVIMWLVMRGALSANVTETWRDYYLPSMTGIATLILENNARLPPVDTLTRHRLIEPAWRERFLQSPQSLYAEAGLSEEEQQLLNARDWRGLIQYGASFFLLEKMGAVVGVSNLHIYAAMRGQTLEAFQQTRNQQVTYSVAGKR